MQITVSGKQVDLSDALRTRVSQHLDTIAGKYFDHALEAHVTFSRARSFFTCDINLHAGRGLTLRGPRAAATPGRTAARYLVVTEGALAGTRITLGSQPVLIGRADDSTLVLTDDYASTRHARLSQRGADWYVEDLGSTNGTYLDRSKVTTAVRVPIGTPVRLATSRCV